MELVRVVDKKLDRAWNVGANFAEAEGLTVTDAPTHRNGRPIPPTRADGSPIKPRTTFDEAAAAKKGTKAPAKKTAGKAATPATSTSNPPSSTKE